MNKLIIIAVILIVIAGGIYFYIGQTDAVQPTISQTYASSGEIAKVVYDINEQSTIQVCQNDCAQRGGIFNECGNSCAPGAAACDTVCAVTCIIDSDVSSVPVRQVYRNSLNEVTKVIYDATGSEDLTPFRNDCENLGGEFETCGNICEPGAQACVEVCAVTCTFT